MPGYREIIVSQGVDAATRFVAARVRTPKTVKTDDLPEAPRPALEAAEKLVVSGGQEPAEGQSAAEIALGPMMYPDGLFDSVEDREECKLILEKAIKSPRPVNVLMVGDPASGKSELLRCCATMPGTRYAVGGMTTSAGLVEYLLQRKQTTKIILIDELDKAKDTGDYAALYELMESGQVPVMMHGKTEVVRWRGRIFAAANSADRLPEALVDRFVVINLPPYTSDQLRVINRRIVEREGLSTKRANEIAEMAAGRSQSPRDARDIARLAGEDGDLEPIARHVIAPKRGKSG